MRLGFAINCISYRPQHEEFSTKSPAWHYFVVESSDRQEPVVSEGHACLLLSCTRGPFPLTVHKDLSSFLSGGRNKRAGPGGDATSWLVIWGYRNLGGISPELGGQNGQLSALDALRASKQARIQTLFLHGSFNLFQGTTHGVRPHGHEAVVSTRSVVLLLVPGK